MSEQLPYNDDQWNELPVPDGDISWQKMELLLDKDRKRRVPFWFWRYAAVGFLLIGAGVGGWLWLHSDNKKTEQPGTSENTRTPKQNTRQDATTGPEDIHKPDSKESTIVLETPGETPTQEKLQQEPIALKPKETSKNKKQLSITAREKTTKPSQTKERKLSIKTNIAKVDHQPELKENQGDPEKLIIEVRTKTDSLSPSNTIMRDSIRRKDSTKAVVSPPVVTNDGKKKDTTKPSSFIWSAGAGLQQSISINGQQSSSYNYKGKRNPLSDHIPSVYLRVQKAKWFAQIEFQYGMPQPVQNFSFRQKTKYDVANLTLTTEKFTLQKLYYHQLPVSINYHILPNFSVGAGAVYNIFAGAVTEQELRGKNVLTSAETITRNLAPVKGFKDSFLYKTTAGILLQTDYHWKRFSLGLRFTQNLQPFIKYTRPDGTVLDEKSQALQAVLRFRLWNSK